MSNEPNGFAKYLVIFVDILGSQNRVDFQETYKINKIFHEELERNKQNDMMHTVYFRKIYTFSDCAYIFYGFKDGISDERKDEGELFKVALCNCEPIFLRFIKERILFRGGISYGDAYVDPSKSMFFGDAVNKAYKMESEIAIHPRIVIDDYIAEAVLENISSVKYKIVAKNPEYISILGAGLVLNTFHCHHIEIITHTVTGNHTSGKLCRLLNIIGRTSCNGMENQFFRSSSPGKGCNLIFEFFF